MKKFIFAFLLASISGVTSANCTWGNCTPAERLQENRQNQMNQLNSISNSLQQIQQQQYQAPGLGQWSNTPQQIAPNPWGTPPMTQQVTPCFIDALGRTICR
jgi:hypothetical protein